MIVITGATGNTATPAAEALLAKGERIRVIGRDAAKLEHFASRARNPSWLTSKTPTKWLARSTALPPCISSFLRLCNATIFATTKGASAMLTPPRFPKIRRQIRRDALQYRCAEHRENRPRARLAQYGRKTQSHLRPQCSPSPPRDLHGKSPDEHRRHSHDERPSWRFHRRRAFPDHRHERHRQLRRRTPRQARFFRAFHSRTSRAARCDHERNSRSNRTRHWQAQSCLRANAVAASRIRARQHGLAEKFRGAAC